MMPIRRPFSIIGRVAAMFVAVLVATGSAANAADLSLKDVVDRLEQAEKEVRSASFDYYQEIAYPLTGEKQVSSGSFIFQKPSRLRITQTKPAEQVIISNGKKVWVYTPSYKQVVVDSWKRWARTSAVPSSLLNFGHTWSELKKEYTFRLEKPEDGMTVLVMVPENKDAWQMKFWLENETFVPVRTVVSSENATITTKTSAYRKNPSLDPSIFTFTPPPGTETIALP